MEQRDARQTVADAGRMLLREKLVARTWGNVSCRTGAQSFAITPSGLGYEGMTAEDVVLYDMTSGTWTGSRKPSSERGVHAAAYAKFPEVGFVIHTHQTYASALSLAGFDTLALTDGQKQALGGVAAAGYGLPGTKKLRRNVAAALASGAHTVLMAQHGALIAGRDRQEAFERAKLLEAVCASACMGQPSETDVGDAGKLAALAERAGTAFPHIAFTTASEVREASKLAGFRAQLDDMAQMIGLRLKTVPADEGAIAEALAHSSAVLAANLGAVCRADTEGDCEALKLLTEKACVCLLHTRALGVRVRLSLPDAYLMRMVYCRKYSAKIGSGTDYHASAE